MDGILIIDKPAGITSHDVVSRVRRILHTKRVGHTGTLDPFATGVMVILVGQATRLAQFLDKDQKEYEAVIRFGVETDTGDLTGSRIADCGLDNEAISELLASTEWDTVLDALRGEIEQVPPMYSAKKIDGKKLYEHARKGETVERKAVKVKIHKLEKIDESAIRSPQSEIRICVACSAGTYIRTLAQDIGRSVGIGAHLTELRRTAAGKFTIGQSLTFDQLAALDDPKSALKPMQDAVSHLSTFELPGDRVAQTHNGLSTRFPDSNFVDGESIQMLDPFGQLVAIGSFDASEKIILPKVVLV